MAPKLNEAKIRWIIREMEKGDLTRVEIAWAQKVSRARVYQLWRAYRETGEIPVLKRPGRPPVPLEPYELRVVEEAYGTYKVGARLLEDRIEADHGIHLPHNRIHKIMLHLGIAREDVKKKRRRTWVRYERPHSMELWHTDWKWISQLGEWVIAYLDDASRFVVSYGTFPGRSTKAAVDILEAAIAEYGVPNAVLTDRGSEFYANAGERKARGLCAYQVHLAGRGIRHIVGRVNHPQTNGKIERLYGTVEQKLPLFDWDVDAFVDWYNRIKPHMSLSLDGRRYDTPYEAFWYKLPEEWILQYASPWFWEVDG